ncbi:GSCFA domain-containing protein [Neorhizobium sp. AL 9.2.2]|uniref:GSCFA domain-containing protein n=1 Tax=Neorhizobium sp. AL 9.2.2 TaxID=2712894 RepID=UPI001574B825|nr:GSCFA domain-containing protein [Neorhizobium sp. AL 9.2.2]NSY19764.1 GSCFA domain-containing protein [Neorhizobium sp. AL 9.2.2]
MSGKQHPYKALSEKAFWRRSVAGVAPGAVDPVGRFALRITKATKVATAGSCFAQHIARHLSALGFNYLVTEPGHPILTETVRARNNYGLFSARYGNIYTARQLGQLFKRAHGTFVPREDCWIEEDGTVRDPFRPTSQPGGFLSQDEMRLDRRQHLAAVRRMFADLDVFVFTLGLTECWASRIDGAVFPLCPGVEGGQFDPDRHVYVNQTVEDVIVDLSDFVLGLKAVNPRAEVVLTVSPVPLAATAEAQAHVLSATTYSKSVLRVAAEMLTKRFANVHYFPSYEIITGAHARGSYFAEDLRSVTESGVSHVMTMFTRHATDYDPAEVTVVAPVAPKVGTLSLAEQVVQVECDEALLDRQTR